MMRGATVLTVLLGILGLASGAFAHASINGTAIADTNQVLTINVGHGCGTADVVAIEVTIPSTLTSVRGLPSTFGAVTVVRDQADLITAVRWTKDTARERDELYYQVQIRGRIPNMPFTSLTLPVTQHCRAADGTESLIAWDGPPDDAADEPAPRITIMPARFPGWNQYTAPAAIDDLSMFRDALIVWSGDAAYSANPTTAAQIEAEEGVTTLQSIAAKATFWVKY